MNVQKKIMLPNGRPNATQADVESWLEKFGIDRVKYPLIIVGIRGYYEKSMGDTTKNDRGIYDDAGFILSPNVFKSFNFNCDPSFVRKGKGTGADKGMLSIKSDQVCYAHKFGFHRGKYLALVQREFELVCLRDNLNGGFYEVKGIFGANIHKGGSTNTFSEGCQTVPPFQWQEFINLASSQAKSLFADKWDKVVIPYVLIDKQ